MFPIDFATLRPSFSSGKVFLLQKYACGDFRFDFFSTPLSEVLWDGFVASIGDLLPFQAFSPENEGFTSKFLPDFNSGQISTF